MSTLTELHNEIKTCQKCQLFKGATRAVPGEGPADSRIMFIGEAPGFNEDQQGRPFVGAAGKFLDELIASINLRRDQVYITNVVKHRPPDNREPLPGEIEACRPWLDRQIELIRPRMIVTLGRYSMARFFPDKTISKVHGTAVKKDGILYFAMYHPAAALHQGNLRATLESDMRKIPPLIEEMEKVVVVKEKPEQPKQLNLFQG
jgi:uracil-DNA glycosylase family 4